MTEPLKRISIRNKKFEGIQNVDAADDIDIIVVGVAYVSRIYYADGYSSDKVSTPSCWSDNCDTPALEVPEETRQAGRCIDCKQNVRGSSGLNSRACRFVQRLAVVPADNIQTVYQLQLPPTSIFGNAVGGKMPFRAYANYLQAQETPIVTVVTKIFFDNNSGSPKLFFRPVRPLEEEQYEAVKHMMEHPDTATALNTAVIPLEDDKVSPFDMTEGFVYSN